MSESAFNNKTPLSFEGENEILLPVRSARYRYFKTMRLGLLNFVKRPSPQYEADMLTIEALRKEFMLCYPLSHPSLVRYIAFENNSLFEEFIDGSTLQELMDEDDERLRQPDFAESVVRQLLDVLDYIHLQGILHLDIKPANLMISRIGNNLKLIDFSCAQSSSNETTGGFTPEFKAPEQGLSQADASTDLYLAGKTAQLLAEKSGLSRRWKPFLEKALHPDPSARFQSAREALAALPVGSRKKIRSSFSIGFLVIALSIALLMLIFKPFSNSKAEEHIASTGLIATDSARGSAESETKTIEIPQSQPENQPASELPVSEPTKSTVHENPGQSHDNDSPSVAQESADYIYIVGNVNGKVMDPSEGVKMTGKNGVYSGVFEFTPSASDNLSHFCFVEELGGSWDETGIRWAMDKAHSSKDYEIDSEKEAKYGIGEQWSRSFKVKPGRYYVKFDSKKMQLTFRPA